MATQRWVKGFSEHDIDPLEQEINNWVQTHEHKVIIVHTSISSLGGSNWLKAMVTYYLEHKDQT